MPKFTLNPRKWGILNNKKPISIPSNTPPKPDLKSQTIVLPPAGKTSVMDDPADFDYEYSTGQKIAKPGYDLELIPLIRQLSKFNPDLGQAVFDLTMLANTGVEIKFDNNVSDKQELEMRRYLTRMAGSWHEGCAGIAGLTNKMFYQLWIAGAISNEWVPDRDMKSLARVVFLNPEKVVWKKKAGKYRPYQKVKGTVIMGGNQNQLHPLNPHTFRYYALNGDEDSPYGTPPMLNAISAIKNQGAMLDNIAFVIELMGLLGYVDAKIEKPIQQDDESDAVYRARLTTLLQDMKTRVKKGLRDGVNVGFKEDHEFEFQSTTRQTGNIESIWELNEQQVASGMKFDTAFLGRSYGASETSITILFTKMLSILTNAQNTVAHNLEYGFTLALLLAGYKFESIKVEFKKSTITDTLKYQQAEEYKIRNQRQLRMDGIIDQTTYANNVGYDSPYQEEPVVPFEKSDVYDKEDQRRKEKGDRQDADKKTRDKSKPQGTKN